MVNVRCLNIKIYAENLKRINLFYGSKLYEEIKNEPSTIKKVIDAIYVDPDMNDKQLLNKANKYSEQFKMESLLFSPDGICGWKILFDVFSNEGNSDWLKKYEIIQKSNLGHLYFPADKDDNHNITINCERNIIFGDRVDMFLYDFKLKVEGNDDKCKLKYSNENTKKFVEYYAKKGKNGFQKYIDDFNLNMFVDNENNVKNIETERILTEGEFSAFTWSNRYGSKRKKKILESYLSNLIKMCKNNTPTNCDCC